MVNSPPPVDNRAQSYLDNAKRDAAAREAAAKKKAAEQAQTQVNIDPSKLVYGSNGGTTQVAIQGNASNNVIVSSSPSQAPNGASGGGSTSLPSTTVNPVVAATFQGRVSPADLMSGRAQSRVVPISSALAGKLSSQSVRDDVNYSLLASDNRPRQSVDVNSGQQYPENLTNKSIRLIQKGVSDAANSGANPLKMKFAAAEVLFGSTGAVAGEFKDSLIMPTVKGAFDKPLNFQYSDIPEQQNLLLQQQSNQAAFANTLVSAGTISTDLFMGEIGTARVADSAATKAFNEQVSPLLKNKVLSNEDVDIVLNFFDKDLTIIPDKRLVKSKISSQGQNDLSVELAIRPIEEVRIIGKSTKGAGVEQGTQYMILKKGESELMNPLDIPRYDAVQLEGVQRIKSGTPAPDENFITNPLLETNPQLKRLPNVDGTLGSLSTQSENSFSITRNVKDVVESQHFSDLVGLKGANIEVGDFVARINSLDFTGAKVFRKQFVDLTSQQSPLVTSEETILNIKGLDFSKGNKAKPGYSFDQIGFRPTSRYNSNQIEDMRFRLEFVDKKQLVARNIKSVTEYESGFTVNLYTYDDFARVFRNVDVFIPKKPTGGANILAGTISTASDIIKKNNRKEDSGSIFSNAGNGQVNILKTDKKVEPEKNLKVDVQPVNKPKTGSESKNPQQNGFGSANSAGSPSGRFYPEHGFGFNSGSKIYFPEDSGLRVFNKNDARLKGFLFGNSKSDVLGKSASGSASAVLPKFDVAIGQGQFSGQKQGQGQSQGQSQGSSQSRSSQISQSSMVNQFLNPKHDLTQRNTESTKNPRLVIPLIDFKRQGLFDVEVKRQGIFKRVGSNLDLGSAISLGKLETGNSAARSFKVLRFGQPVDLGVLPGFYSKGNTQIEKSRFAINTPGELGQITFKGIQASKNKDKKKSRFLI